jgi:hypothetical protein
VVVARQRIYNHGLLLAGTTAAYPSRVKLHPTLAVKREITSFGSTA